MISILQSQLFKLKKSKTFWALLIVCAVSPIISMIMLLGLSALLNFAFNDGIEVEFMELLDLSPFDQLVSTITFSSDSAILALICTAVVLCSEFTKGTLRNSILANKNRSQIFFAYFVIGLIIGVSFFISKFVVTLGLFGAVFGFNDSAQTVVTTTFCHLAMGLTAVLVVETSVLMVMFTAKKTAPTIIFPLLICMIMPSVVNTVANGIVTALMYMGKEVNQAVLEFIPFYNWTVMNPSKPSGVAVGTSILYNLVLSAGFFAAGYFPFQKADLK